MTTGFPDDFATVGHAELFPIGPGDKHALNRAVVGAGTLDCEACHGGRASFAEFNCVACHNTVTGTEALRTKHLPRGAAYRAEESYCYGCHSCGQRYCQSGGGGDGEGEGEGEGANWNLSAADHAPYFPVDPGAGDTHGGVSCESCHSDGGGDPSLTLCSECHLQNYGVLTNTAHSASTIAPMYDANDDTNGCRECHSTTPLSSVFPPPFETFHNGLTGISAGYGTNHWGPAHCRVCHTQRLDPPKEWSINYGEINCTAACHSSPHGEGCTPSNKGPC